MSATSALSVESVKKELQKLRQGQGLAHPGTVLALSADLRGRITDVAELEPDPANEVVRTVAALRQAIESLGKHERLYAQVDFNLVLDHSHPTLTERQESLASRLGCASKTVRRRADEALDTLALLIVADDRSALVASEPLPAVQGWRAPAQGPTLLEESFTPDEGTSHASENGSRVDLVTVARLRQRVQDLDARYDLSPSISLLAETGQCLGQVAGLGPRAATAAVRRELRVVEAECATLMGQLVWDASQRRDDATACAHFDQAIEAARFLGNKAVEGLALLRKSFVELYGKRDPRVALRLTTQTAEVARGTSHVLTGLAVLHAAEAHAMLGDERDCEQALGEAEVLLGRAQTTDPAIDLFSPSQQGRLAGSCYLFLNKAKRAQLILEETARVLQDRSKSQAIVLGNLALACIRQRHVDEAAAMLHRALDVVEQTWGGGGLNVAFIAGRELQPWRDIPVVREVHDRLFILMGTS